MARRLFAVLAFAVAVGTLPAEATRSAARAANRSGQRGLWANYGPGAGCSLRVEAVTNR